MLTRLWSWQGLWDMAWLLFLITMFSYYWVHRRNTLKIKHWHKALGRITKWRWTLHGHAVWLKIEYVYQVEQQSYFNTALFFEQAHVNPNSRYARKFAYKLAQAYQHNEQVPVYYNPEAPGEAVLDLAPSKKLTAILILVTVLITLHLVLVVLRIY